MGVDIVEPGMDLANAVGILRRLGFFQQGVAFGIGGEHDFGRRLRAARRLLGDDCRCVRRD